MLKTPLISTQDIVLVLPMSVDKKLKLKQKQKNKTCIIYFFQNNFKVIQILLFSPIQSNFKNVVISV